MIPTQRVYLLLLLALAIALLLSLVWQAPDRLLWIGLGLGLADSLILAVMVGDGWRGRSQQVQVSRQPIDRLSIGRENPITLSLQGAERSTVVRLRDGYPTTMVASPSSLETAIAAQTTQTLCYTVRPSDRGEYSWGAIHLRQLSPWRLAWLDWTVPQTQSVAVYPDLIGLRALSIRLTLQSSGNLRRAQRLGMGTEFAELREYGTGDDPRLIDWKATARRSRPLIRVLEPEQEQTLIILLDRGRLMTAQVEGLKRFDWGLNAALALALTGLNRGDRVGMAVFDQQIHTWVPPERGQAQLAKLVDRLTPIQPDLIEPDYFGTVSTLVTQQTRRALVVLLTDIVDAIASAELLAAMGRLTPRYLPFCVTLRDPEVDRIAHTTSLDVSTTYTRAVALDLINQRQHAFAKLKQQGVMVLDAPANQITEQLVDGYLRLKAKGRL